MAPRYQHHSLLRALLAVLLSAALTRAFVFPRGLPDGVYKIPIDDKGNALRGPIFLDGLHAAGIPVRPRSTPPLPKVQIACGRDRVDKGALEHVKELFENMCEEGREFDPGTAVVISASDPPLRRAGPVTGSMLTWFRSTQGRGGVHVRVLGVESLLEERVRRGHEPDR